MSELPSIEDISTPEQLGELIAERSDADVLEVISTLGIDAVLDACFESMRSRFLPQQASGRRAVIHWRLATPEGSRDYQLQIADGSCSVTSGSEQRASVTIDAALPTFLRLIAGRLHGLQAYSDGLLRVSGDEVLALVQQTFFEVDLSGAQLQVNKPSELRKMLMGRSDEEIEAGTAVTGIDHTLEQVFAGMVDNFLGHRAGRRGAVVEFRIRARATERTFQFQHEGGRASYSSGSPRKANVSLMVGFPDFLRMVAGELDSLRALAVGKVKVRGNLLLARKIPSWFDQSG